MGQMTKRDFFFWFIGLGLIGIGAPLWAYPNGQTILPGFGALLAGTYICGRVTLAAPARPGPLWAVLVRSVLILAGLLGMLGVAAVTPFIFRGRFAISAVGQLAPLLGLWLAVPTAFTAGVTWRNGLKATEAGTLWLTIFAIFPVIVVLYRYALLIG
jgi:hypothetical protein